MPDTEKLVAMLRDPKASVRYEACELLRVEPAITPEALAALEAALEDTDPDVVERAAAALKHHRANTLQPGQPEGTDLFSFLDLSIALLPAFLMPLAAFFAFSGFLPGLNFPALTVSFAEPLGYAGPFCGVLLLPAAFYLPWIVIVGIILRRRGKKRALLAGVAVGVFSSVCLFLWMQARLA
jgi:hypothetical protein